MQSKEAKREAIRKFKERKPHLGAFEVRCTATGGVWVGASRNLDATKNSVWFRLRTGIHPDPSLQKEWNAYGESAFQYEVLEKLDDDVASLVVADLLKEKRNHWIMQLGARPL